MEQQQLPAVQTKQELQLQERKHLENGRALMLATRSQPIGVAYDADIKTMLKYVMMKLGIKGHNLPDEVEKQVLLDHIKTNYPNNGIDEIRLAFELALNDKLDIDPDKVTAYENFSCIYFSRIMNAYLEWAAAEYKYLKHEPPPQKIYTDDENDNLHRELTEKFYQRLRNGIAEQVPDYVRTILVKDKLIEHPYKATAFLIYKLGIQQEHIYIKTE